MSQHDHSTWLSIAVVLTVTVCAADRWSDLDDTRSSRSIRSNVAELKSGARTSASEDYKVCSCVKPDAWRDTTVVPDNWTLAACASYCKDALLAEYTQVMCFSNSGFIQGPAADNTTPLSPPAVNTCGW